MAEGDFFPVLFVKKMKLFAKYTLTFQLQTSHLSKEMAVAAQWQLILA